MMILFLAKLWKPVLSSRTYILQSSSSSLVICLRVVGGTIRPLPFQGPESSLLTLALSLVCSHILKLALLVEQKRVSNIGIIQPYSFEPDASSDKEQEDMHRSTSRLQVDASECYCFCNLLNWLYQANNRNMVIFCGHASNIQMSLFEVFIVKITFYHTKKNS